MKIVKVEVPYDIRKEEISGALYYKLYVDINGCMLVYACETDISDWNIVATYSPERWLTAKIEDNKP